MCMRWSCINIILPNHILLPGGDISFSYGRWRVLSIRAVSAYKTMARRKKNLMTTMKCRETLLSTLIWQELTGQCAAIQIPRNVGRRPVSSSRERCGAVAYCVRTLPPLKAEGSTSKRRQQRSPLLPSSPLSLVSILAHPSLYPSKLAQAHDLRARTVRRPRNDALGTKATTASCNNITAVFSNFG
jgi:hypothetical protein